MRKLKIFRFVLYASLPTIALLLALASNAADSNAAKVSYLEGDVSTAKSREGPWSKLAKDAVVSPGAFIKTGKDGRLELALPDKSVLRIASNSLFEVTESLFPKKEESRIFSAKLWLGSIWARVNKSFRGETKFKVKTRTAVAGVRGTVWSVDAEESGASLFKVYDGQVAVTPPEEKLAKAEKSAKEGEREEVEFPEEISQKEWFELLLGRLQGVKIAADGKPGEKFAFDPEKDKDEWTAWNLKRDSELEKKSQ